MAEGIELGVEQGIEQGIEQNKLEMARQMKKEGVDNFIKSPDMFRADLLKNHGIT